MLATLPQTSTSLVGCNCSWPVSPLYRILPEDRPPAAVGAGWPRLTELTATWQRAAEPRSHGATATTRPRICPRANYILSQHTRVCRLQLLGNQSCSRADAGKRNEHRLRLELRPEWNRGVDCERYLFSCHPNTQDDADAGAHACAWSARPMKDADTALTTACLLVAWSDESI